MKPTRNLIRLPSGGSVKIRKLSVYDYSEMTFPPKGASEKALIRAGVEQTKIILTRCTGKIRFSETDKRQIVDKSLDDSDDLTEITIDELDQDDAEAIVSAVKVLSGLTKEAGDKPKPFPESPNDGSSPSPGENLPQAAD